MAFEKLRQLVSDVQNAVSSAGKKEAITKASDYVDSMGSELNSAAAANGINIFSSGDNFKDYLTSKTGVDESIFTKSVKEIQNLDLSGITVEKQAEDKDGENYGFYSIMNELYSDDAFGSAIDANGDGKITDKEAKDFISYIKGMDSNSEDVSLDDIAYVVDELAKKSKEDDPLSKMFENFQKSFSDLTDKWIEQIDNAKHQGAIDLPTGGGIASNPYNTQGVSGGGNVPGSSGSASNSAQSQPTKTNEETKGELEAKINECNKEISDINALVQADVKKAVEDRDAAKEAMEKQMEQDEKIDKKTREEFNKVNGEIEKKQAELSKCEGEITQAESSKSQGEGKLSSLESALKSLAKPTGKEEDKDSDAKINERKSNLESQIKEQKEANKKIDEKIEKLKEKKEQLEKELNDPKEGLLVKKQELQEKIEKNCSDKTKEAIKNYEEKEKAVEETKASKLTEVQGELKTAQDKLKKVEDNIQTDENKKAENKFDADFDKMLGHVLGSEGGFSNHPADRGGATNFGITEATYRAYKGDSSADVRNITKDEVVDIYYKNYYQASGAEQYAKGGDSAYAFAVFDAAVNHGVGSAKKMDAQAGGDVDKFMQVRKQRYIDIVANNPSQQVFEKGWQNRWNSVYAFINPAHKYENYVS